MTTTQDIAQLSPEQKRALLEQMLREKAAQASAVPLSFSQQRLWFLDQLEPNSPLYNIPTVLRLTGDLNVEALASSLNEIVERHEALRTTFPSVEGTPMQRVDIPRPVPFETIDLSGLPEDAQAREEQRRIQLEVRRPFDLTKDLMIRATLIRLDADQHTLVLVTHHIASDEWSLRVLFKELALIYEARLTGRDSALPELAIQYPDFALWQREWMEGGALEEQLSYWRKQLEGCVPNLELPSDRPRPAQRKHAGAHAHRTVPRETLEALKEFCRRENATMFMTLLGVLNGLLHRYTRQDDLLVGSPIAGRTREETEELIGFFVNTLVLRTQVNPSMTFRELVAQVRQTTLGAYANQDVPFEKLVETLHPDRSASSQPLVQVMFAVNSDFVEDQFLPGVRIEMEEVDTGTAKFDFTWVAQETRGGLALTVEYDTELFEHSTIERWLEHFENLLTRALANPDKPIPSHSLLGEAEFKRVVKDFNQTKTDYPREASVARLFEEVAANRPNALAAAYGASTLSYGELNRRANQLAHRLRKAGATRGEPIALLMERSCEMIVAMLAVLKAGGAYVPLDPSYPKDRLAFMLKDAECRLLIAHGHLLDLLPDAKPETIALDRTFAILNGEETTNLAEAPAPMDMAYIIYTSGSTGIPKGVCVTHRGIVRLVRNTDYVSITPEDVVIQASNASFDAATFEIWGALLNGASMTGLAKEEWVNPAALRERMSQSRPTITFVTTALFNQLAADAPGIFGSMKSVMFGGEACDPKAIASVLANKPPRNLLHAYGPTECTVFSTMHLVKEVPHGATTVPIGKPIANSAAYVLDPAGNPTPIGVPGELWLGGDGIALGYLKRPELTNARFAPDRFSGEAGGQLYKSGDLARFLPNGDIEFIGRLDDQVKIRGFRIELGEIEAALLKFAGVRKAAVLARQDTPGEKRLAAYIEWNAGAQQMSASDLKAELRRTLPDFMVPAAIVYLEKMPLTPNGKADRKALPAPEWSGPAKAFQAPENDAEKQIAKIWEQVLNVQPVGVTDNFFDLGGHSLLAVKLFAQIEKAFNAKLPLATLFKAPTIREIAQILTGDQKSQGWSTIVDIQPKGTQRPIFWVHSLGGDGGGGFFYYRKLAELLGEDQPSFGIRSPQEPFDKIEAMAAFYIREMRAKQPQGPYQLGGFCFGGVVAYEMARQLEAAGEQVGLLAVLESGPPNLDKVRPELNAESAPFVLENVYENLREFVHQPSSAKLAMVKQKARKLKSKLVAAKAEEEKPAGLDELIDMTKYPKDYVRYAETHWKAMSSYQPGHYDGRIHLFRARKQPLRSFDPSLGWNTVAPGHVKILVIPGTHESMVQEPNVQILAAKLKEAIAEASRITSKA